MIIVLFADGFEEIEALLPVDMLRRAGLEVRTVSISGKNPVGAHGIEIKCDATPEDIELDKIEAVIFPGGMPGAANLDASPYTDLMISAALKNGGRLAAICAAPLILGRRGLLKGKAATCYPGFESELVGATVLNCGVATDGNITTARGMGVALEFAEELISLLQSKVRAEEISKAICKEPCNAEHYDNGDEEPEQSPWASEGIDEEIAKICERTEKLFEEEKIGAVIDKVTYGPRAIRLEVLPKKGEKISRILGMDDDLSLFIPSSYVRIDCPVPGSAAIGIEVPRRNGRLAPLSAITDSEEFKGISSDTAVGIGFDLRGEAVYADIAKMPHAIVSGATGTGKSVFIHSMLHTVIHRASPDDLKLVLIDPKMVEFSHYSGLPHLLMPIITDNKRAIAALRWAVEETDRRYSRFTSLVVRNIESYNKRVREESLGEVMPRIVIVIDELADLMLTSRRDAENYIVRLAQKSRAAGIHLIIGTQRPTANVISGVIKANMPTRVCFKVCSVKDSTTVIDMKGAERLSGNGDALYSYPGITRPVRVQTPYVSDLEVQVGIDALKEKHAPLCFDGELLAEIDALAEEIFKPKPKAKRTASPASDSESPSENSGEVSCDEVEECLRDERFIEAVEIAIMMGKISTSMIQRRFMIGYARAVKFLDAMEELGIVSPMEGQKPRSVLITMDQWFEMRHGK